MIVAVLGIMQLYNFYYENKISHDTLLALDSIVMVIFVFVSLYYFYSARKFYRKYNQTTREYDCNIREEPDIIYAI